MNVNELVKEDINEFCIACLEKSEDMLNLTENKERQELFTNLFNVKLNEFEKCPNFLCCTCDTKLNLCSDFYHSVQKSLMILEEYNKISRKLQLIDFDDEHVKELYEEEDVNTEESAKSKTENRIQHRDVSKIKIIDPDEVERVIEEFKSRLSKNETCIICGFIAANRRSISSHMAIFHKDIKNNWCLECNDVFENYEKHKKSHSSRYQCPFCTKKVTVPHYIEHLRSHSGTFECKECNKTFKSAAWLTKHSRIHTNEKPYICPNCSRGFIQLSSLRYHLGTHGKHACDLCKKRYKTEKDLEEHECVVNLKVLRKDMWANRDAATETEIGPVETIIIKGVEVVGSADLQNFCKDCNKRVKSLKQHIKKFHSLVKEQRVVKKIKCEFCEKIFSNSYKLKIHTRTHTGQLPYKCKYCERRTLTRSRLKDHERTHTKEKPYICNICGKGLSQSSALRTHMRQHTGRPEVCNLCSKTFCRKSELKLHLSKHKGEKPFLCTDCGRTFAQRSHLSEHMASHSDERPFECPYCDKRFKTNNLLKEHLKLHQGYKPFQCPTCSYACYKGYRLQQHMKQHSNADAEPVPKNPA
ncbi:zinc finger protein 2-like [Anoplophora glabripennis]|uniref:zinc finger protein 2-like n=1 Tax=Anoplophora glabripennis TaxID=217634 RepID=UPI0008742395|nr:zinc finger protein 2-like [Anoplophora glabripennis]